MPFWGPPLIIACGALGLFLWTRHQMSIPPERSRTSHLPLLPMAFLAILIIILCGAYVLGQIRGPL